MPGEQGVKRDHLCNWLEKFNNGSSLRVGAEVGKEYVPEQQREVLKGPGVSKQKRKWPSEENKKYSEKLGK